MQTQKAIKALGKVSLITGGKLALKVLSYFGKEARQMQQSAGMSLIGRRQVKEDGACRSFRNIVVGVCQIGRMRFV